MHHVYFTYLVVSDFALCSCLVHYLFLSCSFINSHPFLPSLCLLVLILLGVFQLGDLGSKFCQLSGLYTHAHKWEGSQECSLSNVTVLCLQLHMCVGENVCVQLYVHMQRRGSG